MLALEQDAYVLIDRKYTIDRWSSLNLASDKLLSLMMYLYYEFIAICYKGIRSTVIVMICIVWDK